MEIQVGQVAFGVPSLGQNPQQNLEGFTPLFAAASDQQWVMHSKTIDCKHGTFDIYDEDELVGLALSMYGEYSEDEVNLMQNCIREGDVVIDVGANIGAFSVPMLSWSGGDR